MKIATIGAGRIGGTLGRKWASKGHEILFSSRNPASDEMQALVRSASHNAKAGSVEEAIAFGEVVLLAVAGTAVEEVLEGVGDALNGKLVIDATNRFDGKSGAEIAHRLANGARIVKAFNSVSAEVMGNPVYGQERASMLFAGDDAEAKKVVALLIEDAGFEPADLGGASVIPALEAFVGGIWGNLARQYGRQTAIRVLKR